MGDLRSSLAFRFVPDPTGAVVKAAEALKKPNKLG